VMAIPANYSDVQKFQELLATFNAVEQETKAKTKEWEQVFEKLSAFVD